MHEKYGPEGLVVIGVCHPRGVERMGEVVKKHDIKFAVVADPDGSAIAQYKPNGFPDYFLIDRRGRIRVAAHFRTKAIEHFNRAKTAPRPDREPPPTAMAMPVPQPFVFTDAVGQPLEKPATKARVGVGSD